MSARSLSGQIVCLESIIFENPFLKEQRQSQEGVMVLPRIPVLVPNGHVAGGVAEDTYKGYRAGLDSACADIVICTCLEDEAPAVLALKRGPGKPYANRWYMPGGAILGYMSILDFLREKTRKETGLLIDIEAFMGVYRNNAEDFPCSVTAVCYLTTVPVEVIRRTQPADGHMSWRLFNAQDLDELPRDETHWYPMHVWRKALETMPER